MKRVKKRLNSVLGLFLALTMLLQPIFAYAEEGDVESMEPKEKYEVIIPISNQGTIKADEERRVESDETQIRYAYQAGEEVALEVVPADGMELAELKVKTESEQFLETEEKEQSYTFKMPEEMVIVEAQYKAIEIPTETEEPTEIPEEPAIPEESLPESPEVGVPEIESPEIESPVGQDETETQVNGNATETVMTEEEVNQAIEEERIISPELFGLMAMNPRATITYLGPITYKGVTVGQFNVNGHLAFCMEHKKTSPPTGTPFYEQTYNDPNIRKVLYYGYGGHGQWGGFSGDRAQGIVVTTCALSYYYVGPGSLGGNPFLGDRWLAPLGDFLRFIQTAPDIGTTEMQLSTSYTESYLSEDKKYQRTENITFSADAQNSITLPLPAGVTLVNSTTGAEGTGNVTVYGGQTFYLKAPLTMRGTWESGNLYGSLGKFTSILCVTGSNNLQNLGYGQYITDPDHYVNLSVKWVQMGDIKITKFLGSDEELKNPAVGAEFTLTHQETGEKVVIVADENGVATTEDRENYPIGRLEGGEWLVEETKTPEGFKTIDPFKVTVYGQGQVFSYIAEDKEICAAIRVVKLDESTGKEIVASGATFKIVDEKGKDVEFVDYSPNKVTFTEFTTDENGQFTLPNQLPYGKYQLIELKAPEGYLLSQEPIDFEVNEMFGWETPLVLKAKDENVMGKIQISKKDEETDEAVSETTFDIVAAEDIVTGDGTIRATEGEVVETLVTDQDGKAESKELYLGHYIVRETQAKPGYVCSQEEYQVELSYKDQETALVYGSLELTNKPTTVSITKTVMGTDKPLEDVQFEIWNKAMESDVDPSLAYKEQYTTDENGKITIKYLMPGTYRLQEKKTVPGYVIDDTIYEFTVDDTGRIVTDDTEDPQEEGEIKVENDFTKVQISKQDATTGKELPGAELELIHRESGKTVEKWTSGEEPHYIEALPEGDYILRETMAPKGYKVAQEIIFTVKSTGEVQKVVMKDELKEGTIRTATPNNFRNGKSGGVKTGDASMILIPVLALLAAAVVIVFVYKRKGKENEKNS